MLVISDVRRTAIRCGTWISGQEPAYRNGVRLKRISCKQRYFPSATRAASQQERLTEQTMSGLPVGRRRHRHVAAE